jgi:predicted HAD superfamily hydrolase
MPELNAEINVSSREFRAVKLASVDVFDTCLTRDIAVPTDLFYQLGRCILPRFGHEVTSESVEHFAAARAQAYATARKVAGTEDVTLNEIWEHLCYSMGWQFSTDLWQQELAIEEEHLVPVCTTRQLIQDLRAGGKRIVFASDTYLPSPFVARLLKQNGFMQPEDRLYTSGEVRRMKCTGSLFAHILSQEKLKAAQMVHFGDDPLGDFKMPRKLGIRAIILSQGRLGRTATAVLRQRGVEPLVASRVAGGIRAFRASGDSANDPYHELVASFLGPVLLGFVSWVLFQARKDGIKRLYFLSRDCQLAFKVAQTLSTKIAGVECRYLYHSRQALQATTAQSIDQEQMWWMRREFEVPALDRLLAKLELKFEDVESDFCALAGPSGEKYILSSQEDWRQFWEILNRPQLRSRILAVIQERRRAACSYLRAEGLFDNTPWALVDLGWYLSCQNLVQELLNFSGSEVRARGYYLGLRSSRVPLARGSTAKALFYEPQHDRECASGPVSAFSYAMPLEFVLGWADHPTVHHYEMNGSSSNPVFLGGQLNEADRAFVAGLHEATLNFIRAHQNLAEEFFDESSARLMLGSMLDRFTKHPDAVLVRALQRIEASGDQNLIGALPLVSPLNLPQTLRWMVPGRVRRICRISDPNCKWLEGSLAVSSPAVRKLAGTRRFLRDWMAGTQGEA